MRICSTLLLLAVHTGAAEAASFDCAHASFPDEQAVCASRTLSERDVELATRYGMTAALLPMGGRAALADGQRIFLAERRRCGRDARCLGAIYDRQINYLRRAFDAIAARGPF